MLQSRIGFSDATSDSFSRRIIEVLSAATGQEQSVHSKTYSENTGIQSHEGIAQNDSHIQELYDLNAKVLRKPHRPNENSQETGCACVFNRRAKSTSVCYTNAA